MSGIEGKVIAVTGASSGIGRATALLLATRGAKLVLGARGIDRLEEVKARIEAAGGSALCLATDVRRREDLTALVALACDQYGKLNVLVSNAGIGPISRFDALCVDDWDAMIDVNVRGVLYRIAAALPVFRQQETGHFGNVISTAGLRIVPSQGVYAATKNAVRTITEALRQEAGDKLRVTGVSPGFVRTEFAESINDPAIREALANRIGDFAISPDAIAQAIAFAMSWRSFIERARRSMRVTTRVSPGCTKSSSTCSSVRPSRREPLAFSARTTVQPAALRATRWIVRSWSRVLTRA